MAERPTTSATKPEFPRILTDEQRRLLAEERRLLGDLRAALARFDASPEDEDTLAASLAQLDELFLVVVAGEFNAGKSAVLNALMGAPLLPEGVTPTTDRIVLLKHRDNLRDGEGEEGVTVEAAEADLLAHMNIVDTPGTNAVLRHHEALTREFIPRADTVLFVTSADRPFTESERAFLEVIRDWGKKIAVVINKIDIVHTEEDVQRIESYVAEQARQLLDEPPAIFPVSARQALKAKQRRAGGEAGDEDLFTASRYQALERYLVTTLDEAERVRRKLRSPLEVGRRLTGEALERVEERRELLAADFRALEDIEGQLDFFRTDMKREFAFRVGDVEKALTDFERRGVTFFEETLRLGRIPDLVNRSKIKAEFARRVVGDLPKVVDERVAEVIDWLVERNLAQWESVRDHVAARRAEHAERIVETGSGGFRVDRRRLLESVGRAAQEAVDRYDREGEAERLAESVQRSVAGTAALEVGAVGVGAAVALTALDVTGMLFAGALFALGLFVLPHRRRRAVEALRERVEVLRTELTASLTEAFEREVDRGVEQIREAVAPYTRFVRAQRESLASMHDELEATQGGLEGLDREIEALS